MGTFLTSNIYMRFDFCFIFHSTFANDSLACNTFIYLPSHASDTQSIDIIETLKTIHYYHLPMLRVYTTHVSLEVRVANGNTTTPLALV